MQNVFITTLGCKVNQYESAAFTTEFINAGYRLVQSMEDADIIVINSCAVTSRAGAQSRQLIRQATRSNSTCRIIITGCYAETAAEAVIDMEELIGRDFSVVGNSRKDQLVPLLSDLRQDPPKNLLGNILEADKICDLPVNTFGNRTRAYLRVQDGCESYCSYCIVPYTRGPSRSLEPDKVAEQASHFASKGFLEIVLTGIHLGNYGKDLTPKTDITTLIDDLTLNHPGIRFRISSLEPTEISDRLLELMSERDNLMPHLHIPLQSGDDEILGRMNRKYTTSQFREIVKRCIAKVPHMAIGIDILAGFPGESERHFKTTCEFISSLPCTYLHVFPYSTRPGTAAASFSGQVDKQTKTDRVNRLRQIGNELKKSFYSAQTGKVLPVLVEGRRDSQNRLKGFSDNYVTVHFHGDDSLKNKVVNVLLKANEGSQVAGEVLK